jgi:hypothetical protein
MRIGTKSVLYGAHTFWIHPWFVAWAWTLLYGFPWDPRLWVAFWVHDLGYFGKPNMDGEEGEQHPEFGARVMHALFDWGVETVLVPETFMITSVQRRWSREWYNFTRYHSRFLAKRDGMPYSRLCVADKLAISLTPAWLYLPLVRLTGEIHEYRKMADVSRYSTTQKQESEAKWYAAVREYCWKWAWNHRDGIKDTWTPEPDSGRRQLDEHGTWQ